MSNRARSKDFTLIGHFVSPWLGLASSLPYTANISSRKNFVVFEVHRSSSKFLSLKVAAASANILITKNWPSSNILLLEIFAIYGIYINLMHFMSWQKEI